MNVIEQLKQQKASIQASLLQAILDDAEMSKLQKLFEIEDTGSMPYDTYLVRPLEKKYSDAFKKKIEEKHGAQRFFIIDSWPLTLIDCDVFHRRERVSLPYMLELLMSDTAYAMGEDNPSDDVIYKQEVVVMRNRCSEGLEEYKITVEQLIDDVYDWVVENNKIGFHFDW